MRKLHFGVCLWACAMGLFSMAATALRADDGPTLLVDDDKVECPTAAFTTIQDAVNAAPAGAKIRVCAGTYKEQVSITKNLAIRGDNGAIVLPSNVLQNTTSLASGNPIAAVILVADAGNVSLENLTVDGTNNGIMGCGPDLIGIFYRNASGKISDVAVRNMKLTPSPNGCQSGTGIFVQSGPGKTSRVEIEGSSIHDFQKNGITGNEVGTDVDIKGNAVTGLGPTTGAAQNGIQVGFGARGTVRGNVVSDLVWSPCDSIGSTECMTASATGILVYSSDDVTVQGNTASDTQGGVYMLGNHGEISGNVVVDTLIFDGVAIVGDGTEVERNFIAHSDESGVSLQGNDNSVTENQINEAPIGVLKFAPSVGNTISGNRFFNTPVTVQDPAVLSAKTRQPYR